MGLDQPPAAETLNLPQPRADCTFCQRHKLTNILYETPAFFLIADHAPLIEGHMLLVPKAHFACYGALAPALDAEFLRIKAAAGQFLARTYRPPVFFEHGVFRQTVFHAHLHCFPFGPLALDLASHHPHAAPGLAEVRAWYAASGQYFYLEQEPGQGALFQPEEMRYFSVLGALRQQAANTQGAWRPALERRLNGQEKIQSLAQKWQEFAAEQGV
jgi:diadenosine tetraphosphate (Ap4A) HIT family hydrolase